MPGMRVHDERGRGMNREEAKTKVMTIYGSLSEDMKQAIDVLVDASEEAEWHTGEPPKYGEYIVTIHDPYERRTYTDLDEYGEDGWSYIASIDVKAWIPLPAPYKTGWDK